MNNYFPYVLAVYLLAALVYGGYTMRWYLSWKKTFKQLEEHKRNSP